MAPRGSSTFGSRASGAGTARAALAGLVAYALAAFGWRSLVQWRRTGDTGYRLSGDLPVPARVASALIAGGAAGGFVATALAARGRRRPAAAPRALRVSGLLVLFGAILVTLRAQLEMGASWRVGVDADERTDLVRRGSFAVVRNPIFTGMALAGFGTALAVPTAWTAVSAAALVAGVQIQVRAVEEPYLLRTHGDAYLEYATRTGRFVPGLGREPAAPS